MDGWIVSRIGDGRYIQYAYGHEKSRQELLEELHDNVNLVVEWYVENISVKYLCFDLIIILSGTLPILRRNLRDIVINLHRSLRKTSVILVRL